MALDEDAWGIVILACLLAASLGSLALHRRFPSRRRDEETLSVVRLTANIFVVMTSHILGLLINSAKNTLDSVDRNIHAFATGLVMLDRWLQHYGTDADTARQPVRVCRARRSNDRRLPGSRLGSRRREDAQ